MKNTILAFSLSLLLPGSAFAQWSSDPMANLGVAVKPDDQVQPKVRPTGDGGCYISWFDNDPSGNPPFGYDVFLQRLDASGVPQFPAGGIRLADLGLSSTQDYGFDVDKDGNALVCFLDDRRKHNPNVVVTVVKVSPAGEQLYGSKGREVARGADFLGNSKVTATSDGSAVAGWIEGNNLMFQRINRSGWKQWGPSGITIAAPAGLTYSLADLHAGDDGSVIASWVSAAGFTGPKHLLANKIGADGTLLWGTDNVIVFDGGSLQFGNFPPFVTDGAGGAVFGWYEVTPLQARAQHILADGTEAFPHNGTPGSTNTPHDQVNPAVSYDQASGDTYLFWDEILEGPLTNEGISGQKFNSTGVAQWGDFGLVVQPFTSSAVLNVTNVFTAAGPLVVWSSEASFGQDSITGAKLSPSGTFLCPPFAVSSILSSKSRLDLTLSVNDVAFAVWSDGRNDGGDIYAQDIKPDCSLGQ
ncbi:MAG: hypothetical protein H0X40_08525 [Chthoniobacterales bacterium]|nr:hypothetical protein [Chthoniobacterales bacterium]